MSLKSPEELKKKRNYVINEIIDTEKIYFDKIRALNDVFINPLKTMKIISEDDLKLQFDGLVAMLDIHKNMYESMTANSAEHSLNMGSIFSNFSADALQCYKIYLVNFEKAMTRRGFLLTKNKKFAKFVERACQDPKCLGCGIESLLISPVQRIPRYRLLLEELLKYTPEGHSEHREVMSSLGKIKRIANQV